MSGGIVNGTVMIMSSRADKLRVLLEITYPSGIPVTVQIIVEIVAVSKLSIRDESSSRRSSALMKSNEPTLARTPRRGRITKRTRILDNITMIARYVRLNSQLILSCLRVYDCCDLWRNRTDVATSSVVDRRKSMFTQDLLACAREKELYKIHSAVHVFGGGWNCDCEHYRLTVDRFVFK